MHRGHEHHKLLPSDIHNIEKSNDDFRVKNIQRPSHLNMNSFRQQMTFIRKIYHIWSFSRNFLFLCKKLKILIAIINAS